jgi:hypothetical protein
MYKDKEVKKNVKNICLSMCDVKVFLTFTFTEYGTVLTTILPILFLYLNTVIVTARTPNNLTKGKPKLITMQTDKISQQPENCENVMTLT